MAFTLNDFNAFPTGTRIRRDNGTRIRRDTGKSENNGSYNIRRLKCGAS